MLDQLTVDRPSLEDIYLRLTGQDGPRHPTDRATVTCVSLTRHLPGRHAGEPLALLWHQIRYEQLSFWRNPQSAFFTFLFPVVIIAIFGGAVPRRQPEARTSTG